MNAPLHLVLDTNTVLALWLFRDPGLSALDALIDGGTLALYSRADALEELRRVLAYAQFGVDPDTQARLLEAYRGRVTRLPTLAPPEPAAASADGSAPRRPTESSPPPARSIASGSSLWTAPSLSNAPSLSPAAPASSKAAMLPACRDRDDQKFLEIAAQAPATHLLTRDKALLKLARHRLLRGRFAILTPERFLAAMPPGSAAPQ
ncbi:MAG: PIN domain-containing protein [Betaproteobacteria bacterium]|nr:MAG: PIN domain-containing protein [Betaproteobacteria bacterium]